MRRIAPEERDSAVKRFACFLFLALLTTLLSAQSPVQDAYARGQKAFQEKRYTDAVRAFDEALAAAPAGNADLLAGLFYYKAAAQGLAGELLPALASAKQAVRYAPSEKSYGELLIKLQEEAAKTVIPADQIGRAMAVARSFTPQGEPASIDLWVNYDLNKDTLSAAGRAQAAELAKAIRNPALAGKHFRFVGHTDAQGSDKYNQELSERRASHLRDYLVEEYGLDSATIQTEGRGKRELKVAENSERANAINRRVEVQLLD